MRIVHTLYSACIYIARNTILPNDRVISYSIIAQVNINIARTKTGRFCTKVQKLKSEKQKKVCQNIWHESETHVNINLDHQYFKSNENINETENHDSIDTDSLEINDNINEPATVYVAAEGGPGLTPLGCYRTIVELDVLAAQLEQCCFCSFPLHLKNSVGVVHKGLGGWVHVKCDYSNCQQINKIVLSKMHHTSHTDLGVRRHGHGAFDVNTKAATGM